MKYINANNINKDKIKYILNKNICLVGIFNKNCIHCKMMKPEWNKFKSKNRNHKYVVLEIDSDILSRLNIKLLSKNINGYPSILLVNCGKFIKEYNNDRTFNDIEKFMVDYINKNTNKFTRKVKKPKHNKKSKKTK